MTKKQKNIVFIFVAFILILVVLNFALKGRQRKPVNIEIWGILDQVEVFQPLITRFSQLYPEIHVRYTVFDTETYEQALFQSFADNRAPDIFMVLGNWLPKYQNRIIPLSLQKEKEFNLKTVLEIYPDVVLKELLEGDKLWGIPLYVDTLALYYNKDVFDHYNLALPPKTWEEILELVPRLRNFDKNGNLSRAAIALGTYNNVNWGTDILAALMMQYGSSIVDTSKGRVTFSDPINWLGQQIIPGEMALRFYTQFSNLKSIYYSWSINQTNSLLSFAYNKTAMVIGYQRAMSTFKQYNPQLNFGVTSFPQFKNSPNPINYANTMNFVVCNRSRNPQAAWLFLKFLAQGEISEKYYQLTQHPPARRDLIARHLNDPITGTFTSQILTSHSWYQPDASQVKEIFQEMIKEVIFNQSSPKEAADNGARRIQFLLR